MAEEMEYPVLLVRLDRNDIEGGHVYRGDQFPQKGQVITVELALSPVPIPGPPKTCLARVTSVVPGDERPIRATELES